MTNERTLNPTSLLLSALVLGLLITPVANAFLAGDGKGKPDRDCYIGLDGFSQEDLSAINHTGHPLEKIEQDTDRDRFMSADEACEYKLVDKVIDRMQAVPPAKSSE
jgi:hypothetical protein